MDIKWHIIWFYERFKYFLFKVQLYIQKFDDFFVDFHCYFQSMFSKCVTDCLLDGFYLPGGFATGSKSNPSIFKLTKIANLSFNIYKFYFQTNLLIVSFCNSIILFLFKIQNQLGSLVKQSSCKARGAQKTFTLASPTFRLNLLK